MTTRGRASLGGLLRLRAVRERDSRIGLAAALTEERAAIAKAAELERQLAALPVASSREEVATFQARQHRVEMLGSALVDARVGQETARHLTLVARDRWVEDRSRLAAVESLIAHRAEALRAERRKREIRDLDAAAEDLWRRRAPDGREAS